MKWFLTLLAGLLLSLPALAEPPAARDAVAAAYPGAEILASAQDEDDAFFILDTKQGTPRRLCGLTLQDGAWTMVIDSSKAIRPSGLTDDFRRWSYEGLSLCLAADTLSIQYEGWPVWQYDFAKEENGSWHFLRLVVNDHFCEELTWADGYVRQTFTKTFRNGTQEVSFTPPCPMPWLAGCETLSGFDASAFPMDLSWLVRDELARVAAELLPGYAFVDGKFSTVAATFLMDNPEGERVFLGGVYENGAWIWTESTPLPADAWCDSFHAGAGAMSVGYDHPGGIPDEFGEYPFVEYAVYLQEDGSWQVESIFDYFGEWFHFEEDGLYINMTGKLYGKPTLERDITKIVWADFPLTLSDALVFVPHDWGVISEPRLPLYADADGAILLAQYHCGTPVRLLEEADDLAEKGWEGHLVRVQIANSNVVGWIQGYGLLTGKDQLYEQVEEDGWSCFATAEEEAWFVKLSAGENLYAAPQGEVITAAEENCYLIFLADWGDGWAHVRFLESLESGFIRLADCVPAKQ